MSFNFAVQEPIPGVQKSHSFAVQKPIQHGRKSSSLTVPAPAQYGRDSAMMAVSFDFAVLKLDKHTDTYKLLEFLTLLSPDAIPYELFQQRNLLYPQLLDCCNHDGGD